mgnify:CR=1 FL=1|jgi:hypothetical protein
MLNLTQKRVRSPEQREEMKKVLDSYGIYELFHFTCVDNLELIAKCGGIWSKKKLEKARLLDEVITGGNEISKKNDIQCKNWDKVSLSFCYGHPMAYNILERKYPGRPPQSAHICYLVIDQEVALWDGVLFAPTNATKSGTQPRGGLEGLNSVNFELIRKYLRGERVDKHKWEDMKKAIQAECLVPDEIPLEYIKFIVFISEASKKEGKRLWESGKSQNPNYPQHQPEFKVNEWYFYNLLRKYYNNLPFSLVDDFVLTPENVNEEIVNSKKLNEFEDKREFSKSQHSEITLLVELYAKSGSKARVEWRDEKQGEMVENSTEFFDKEGGWWLWSKLDISRLNEGDYSVEFYLDDVRWFKASFKIKK